jgi:hypothetical protein
MITVNFKHLQQAKLYAKSSLTGFKLYWWHAKLSLGEAYWLFIWFIGSVIHGIFPFLIDFDLLIARVNRLKYLKSQLPDDPRMKKVEFLD